MGGMMAVIVRPSGMNVPALNMAASTVAAAGIPDTRGPDPVVAAAIVANDKGMVGAVNTVRVPGEGGSALTSPERKRSPGGPVSRTNTVPVPGGGERGKSSVVGVVALGDAVSGRNGGENEAMVPSMGGNPAL